MLSSSHPFPQKIQQLYLRLIVIYIYQSKFNLCICVKLILAFGSELSMSHDTKKIEEMFPFASSLFGQNCISVLTLFL